MKRYWLFTLLFAIVLCCFFYPLVVVAGGVPQEVLEASSSVAYIEIETSTAIYSGSGFIVKNDISGTYLATNNHVLETNPNEIYVWIGENKKRTATILARSEQYDIAIIKLAEPIDGKALTLSEDAEQGDEVFAIGYPTAANHLSDTETHLSNEATITNGIIGSIHQMKNVDYGPEITMLQINADINEGNSGGPLLNRIGQVVGINTYGVLDTQGIFGAISASELKTYIEVNNLFEFDTEDMSSNWILYVGIVVAAVVIGAGLFLFLKSRQRSKKGTKTKGLLLAEYLSRLDSLIDANSIVSLLMPVIIELRDMHNRGTVYLKLSPSRLLVTKEGCSICSSDGQPTDEFISPEQRRGSFAGIKTDIYGVCAILRYIINSNSKKAYSVENNEVDSNSIQLQHIIKKGLAENMDERFSNMQELLYALAPFNTGISKQAQLPFTSENKVSTKKQENELITPKANPSKSLKIKRMLISSAIVIVGLALCGVLIYSTITHNVAMQHAKNYEFYEASSDIDSIPLGETLFPEDYLYITAGVNVMDRDYEAAINCLSAIKDYCGSSELSLEAKYRMAAKLADEGSYEKAVSLYEKIIDYKDSASLISDTKFREACYIINQGEDFEAALKILNKLNEEGYPEEEEKRKELNYIWGLELIEEESYIDAYGMLLLADDYLDAWQLVNETRELLYKMGVDYYRSKEYNKAESYFEVVGTHLDSEAYLTLIKAYRSFGGYFSTGVEVSDLVHLIGFENTSELIMANQLFAKDFLMGTWRGDSRYFEMDDEGITYNLPWINYGDYYKIEDGILFLYKEDQENKARPQYTITILDKDCIRIFAHKNNRSYVLYRQ